VIAFWCFEALLAGRLPHVHFNLAAHPLWPTGTSFHSNVQASHAGHNS
jgi:hypothetical protein